MRFARTPGIQRGLKWQTTMSFVSMKDGDEDACNKKNGTHEYGKTGKQRRLTGTFFLTLIHQNANKQILLHNSKTNMKLKNKNYVFH
jgi:hypothetical protein